MENLLVNCNNCGSSLQIEDEILFTTCRNCKSSLEIVRTYNSVYTKIIENKREKKPLEISKIAIKTTDIDKIDFYKQIELLDNEWQNRLPTFMTKGTLPDENSGLAKFGGIFVIVFGIIWTIGAASISGFFAIFGIFFVIFGIWNLINQNNKTEKYKFAKNNYEQKRVELLRLLNR